MATDDGSGGGTAGAGPGAQPDVTLHADDVRQIADRLQIEGDVFSETGFADIGLSGAQFGGSTAGQDLGTNYDGAFTDAVTRNTECVEMLSGYRTGLVGAVEDLQETDGLNAVAMRQISWLDPGEA